MAEPTVPDIGTRVQIPAFDKFAKSGIYFLYLADEVVYVGQAADMRRRIGQHMVEAIKAFDSVSCLVCAPRDRTALEQYFISKLVPRYNNCLIAKEARRMAKLGVTLEFQRVKKDYVTPHVAAAMMGISIGELEKLGDKGPRHIARRVPRKNIKRTVYEVASIREFLEAA